MEYLLVIDAGGSKTRLWLFGHSGSRESLKLVRQDIFGPGNVTSLGLDAVSELLRSALSAVPAEHRLMCRVMAGFAGASTAATWGKLQEVFVEQGFARERTVVTSDGHLALHALGNPGIVLILGTGTFCLGRSRQKEARAAGMGWLTGSEGSGFWYGSQAIRAAFQALDQLGPATVLGEAVRDHFGVETLTAAIPLIHRQPLDMARIAALTPAVFSASRRSDPVSQQIVAEGAKHSASFIQSVGDKLGGGTFELGFVGGLASGDDFSELLLPQILTHLDSGSDQFRPRNFPGAEDFYMAIARSAI